MKYFTNHTVEDQYDRHPDPNPRRGAGSYQRNGYFLGFFLAPPLPPPLLTLGLSLFAPMLRARDSPSLRPKFSRSSEWTPSPPERGRTGCQILPSWRSHPPLPRRYTLPSFPAKRSFVGRDLVDVTARPPAAGFAAFAEPTTDCRVPDAAPMGLDCASGRCLTPRCPPDPTAPWRVAFTPERRGWRLTTTFLPQRL